MSTRSSIGKTQSKYNETYSPDHFNNRLEHLDQIETKINTEIGFRFWNKYVSAAFWSNISLPINLSITMMTALSTGQATTENLLPHGLFVNISIATLIISVLNTYFRPHIQMNKNLEMMNKWNVLGCEFEEIFYSEKKVLEQVDKKIASYEHLMRKMNELKKTENLETQNFITDIIYSVLRSCECCLKHRNSWLALDESLKIENEMAQQMRNSEPRQSDVICCYDNDSIVESEKLTNRIPTIELQQFLKKYRSAQIPPTTEPLPTDNSNNV